MLRFDTAEIEAFWRRMAKEHGLERDASRHAGTFADPAFSREETIDELAGLAVAGEKRGTAHLAMDFERNRIPRRVPGHYWTITTCIGEPLCLVRLTAVEERPFDGVGEVFAALEGEGDLSLEHWRRVHRRYFEAQLRHWGEAWRDDLPVVCESFEKLEPV